MIEIIPSAYARKKLNGERVFTDFEKATLIWNSPIANIKEKIESLKELSSITDDEKLKQQITERLAYEDVAQRMFVDNQNKHYVYVVFDEERDASGYFFDYEFARNFGIRICTDYEMKRFSIEKQLIFCEKTMNEIFEPFFSKNMKTVNNIVNDSGYEGRESAWANFNAAGEMTHFYLNEVTSKKSEVNEHNNSRFEYRFIRIPPIMEAGTIARVIGEDTYIVNPCNTLAWNKYMDKAEKADYEYADIQTIMFELKEDGSWSHRHVNPIHLEPRLPEIDADNEKSGAYVNALKALGAYFIDNSSENNRKVLEASREYAKICAYKNWQVFRADDIEDILF